MFILQDHICSSREVPSFIFLHFSFIPQNNSLPKKPTMSCNHISVYSFVQLLLGLVPICQAVLMLPSQARLATPEPALVSQGRQEHGEFGFNPSYYEKNQIHLDPVSAQLAQQTMKVLSKFQKHDNTSNQANAFSCRTSRTSSLASISQSEPHHNLFQ